MRVVVVEPLSAADLLAVAQCIALDVDIFPYPSATFGLRDDTARAWVARDSHRSAGRTVVVGFVAGHVRRGALHIEGLAIDGRARRRGIARALVRKLIEGARAEGIRDLALHVSVTNHAAIALYRAEGFHLRRRLPGFYPLATIEGQTDAYEMRLRISRREP